MKTQLFLLFATATSALNLQLARAGDGVPNRYQASYELEAAGDLAGALGAIDEIPKAARATYVFALRRGWLLYLDGRHAEAITAYETAITRAPKAIEPRLGVTLPLLALRRWLDVKRQAEAVLEKAPGHPLAARRLAFALFNLGRLAEAERGYRAVLAQYPADPDMQAGLGWCLLRQGKREEAVTAFRAVLAFSPRNQPALDGLAEANRRSD